MNSFSRRRFLTHSTAAIGSIVFPRALGAAGGAPEKPKAHTNPFVYKFNIGRIEAWSISDGHMLFADRVDKMWPPAERPAMVEKLKAHGERTDGIPLYVNILVLKRGNEVVLCDSGFGARPSNPDIGWVADGLRMIGITPDQVTHALLSHGHSDHIGGFVQENKPVFPNAGLHVLKSEVDFWRGSNPDFTKSHRRDNIKAMIRDVRGQLDVLQPNL